MSTFFPVRKYSREKVAQVFGKNSDAKLAMQIKREEPALYEELRALAVKDKLVGEQVRAVGLARAKLEFDGRNAQREFSEQELRARAQFSKDDCENLLKQRGDSIGTLGNLAAMKKTDPERYEIFRTAARTYGFEMSNRVQKPKPEAPPEPTFTLAEPLRSRFHLPENYQVTQKQYLDLQDLSAKMDAEQKNKEQADGTIVNS